MSNSEAICHYTFKWDLQSGQQNPNYSQNNNNNNNKKIAQVKGLMNLPSSLCLQGTESISNF